MPTTARLVSGICLAILGWIVSDMIRPLMPEDTAFGWFNEVNAVIGFAVGWTVLGSRAGRGQSAAIGNGITGMVALVFWGVFAQAVYLMLQNSLKKRYDGVGEAIAGLMEAFFEYLVIMGNVPIIAALLIGGMASGIVAEAVARRWS